MEELLKLLIALGGTFLIGFIVYCSRIIEYENEGKIKILFRRSFLYLIVVIISQILMLYGIPFRYIIIISILVFIFISVMILKKKI